MNGTLVMTDGEVSLDPHPSESSLPISPIFLNDLATKKYEILPAGEYYISMLSSQTKNLPSKREHNKTAT